MILAGQQGFRVIGEMYKDGLMSLEPFALLYGTMQDVALYDSWVLVVKIWSSIHQYHISFYSWYHYSLLPNQC